jgi:hypothetical protein
MRFASHTVRAALVLAAATSVLGTPRPALAQTVSTFSTVITHACGLAADASGRLYVTSRTPNAKIYRCTPPDTTMTLFASGFVDPYDMVFDDSGNMFVSDVSGHLYKVTPGGGVATIFGPVVASAAPMTRDAAGNLYVGEYFNRTIDKITPAGVKTTYAASIGTAGGSLVMLNMDSDGTLYAGNLNGQVLKVAPGGSPVTTFCTMTGPSRGFVHDVTGAWFGNNYDGQEILQISPGGVVTPYAGAYRTPDPVAYGNIVSRVDGAPSVSRFNWPNGMLVLNGKIYIAEYANNDVRMISYEPTPTRGNTWGRLKALYR